MRAARAAFGVIFLGLAMLVGASSANAIEPSLDPSFHGDGEVLTSFGFGVHVETGARLGDGRVVLAVAARNTLDGTRPALLVMRPDGSFDRSFGQLGLAMPPYVRHQSNGTSNGMTDVAVRIDGRLYASDRQGVMRFLADGRLDPAFGVGGYVSTPGQPRSVFALPDGGAVVIGGDGSGIPLLWRYDQTGQRVMPFGPDPTVQPIVGDFLAPRAAAQLPDGSFVVVADSPSVQEDWFVRRAPGVVLRYRSDGTLDRDFGTDGSMIIRATSGNTVLRDVTPLADGRIAITGQSDAGSIVARLLSDGQLDLTFAGDGVAEFPKLMVATSIAEQIDGSLLVSGVSGPENINDHQTAAIRVLPDGTADAAFGEGGIALSAVINFTHSPDREAVGFPALAGSPSIIVGNTVSSINRGDDVAAAALTSDGKLIPTFGVGGISVGDFGEGFDGVRAFGIATQRDDKAVVVGQVSRGGALARYLEDGSVDPSFGADGTGTVALPFRGRAVAIDAQGRIVSAGDKQELSTHQASISKVIVARHLANGELDVTFGTRGYAEVQIAPVGDRRETYVSDLVIGNDGRIVGGGQYCSIGCYGAAFGLTADGATDPTFGPQGIYRGAARPVVDVGIRANGQVWLLSNTTLTLHGGDASFGGPTRCNCSDGTVNLWVPGYDIDFQRVTVSTNGDLLVAGTIGIGPDQRIGVVRLRPDGSLDTTFGRDGLASGDLGNVRAIVHASDAGIWIAGVQERDRILNVTRVGANGTVPAPGADPAPLPRGVARADGRVALDSRGRLFSVTDHYDPFTSAVHAAWRVLRLVGPGPIAPAPDATAPVLVAATLPAATATPNVVLQVNATDDVAVTQMRVAINGQVIDAQAWQAFTPTVTVALPAVDGPHVVRAQVRDAAGNLSAVAAATTTLLRPVAPPLGPNQPPTLREVTVPNPATTRVVTIAIDATDDRAVTEMRTATEDGNWSAWRAFEATTSMTLSAGGVSGSLKGVYVQVRDAERRESAVLYRKTKFVPGAVPAPVPPPPVNAAPVLRALVAPATTPNPVVLIGIDATDDAAVTEVRTALDGGAWSAWRPHAVNLTLDLSPVAAGATRVLSVQVRDAQLRESEVVRTPISYVPVVAPVPPPPGAVNLKPTLVSVRLPNPTTSQRIAVTIVATDDRAVTQVRLANEDGTWGAWQPYTPTMTHLLTPRAQLTGVYVQVRDTSRAESNTIYTKTLCTPCTPA